MPFVKKTLIHTALFFLFLFSNFIRIHSQEQSQEPIVYQALDSNNYQAPDLLVYPDTVILYSPFLPLVADGSNLNYILNSRLTPECQLTKPLLPPLQFAAHRLFADVNHKNDINRIAYNYLINNNLSKVKYTAADFSGKVERLEEIPVNIFRYLFKIDYDFDRDKIPKTERYHPKRRYWVYNGSHKIQLSQNYISQNWYKGGVKNLNLINAHSLTFNYSKNKLQANNLFEWRLNIVTNPNDTLRRYSISDDLVRLYSTFGVQAINHWYYSSNIEIKTQLLQSFGENSSQMLTSAFSPFYINAGILGMRYQIEKKNPKIKDKKISFNTDIAPLSIEYIRVFNKEIDQTRFGIEADKWHLFNIGSSVNAKIIINFNKNVNFTSRFYYFTNYQKITAESENTLNMPINRYFATTLYLFMRYDDNNQLAPDRTWGYFQVNELISFGFNYNW